MTLPKVGARSASDAVRLLADYHLLAVRRGSHGELVAVKHVAFGWIEPEEYYLLQKLHDLLPLVGEFIQGGYRMNAEIYGSALTVRGVTIPTGEILLGSAIAMLAVSIANEDWVGVLIMLAALLAPFGALITLYFFEQGLENFVKGTGTVLDIVHNTPGSTFGKATFWNGPGTLPKTLL